MNGDKILDVLGGNEVLVNGQLEEGRKVIVFERKYGSKEMVKL